MRNSILITITMTILMALMVSTGQAQTNARIENVDFYLENTLLIINYDIVNAGPDETFYIWIKVRTAGGQPISPINLTGDIGNDVKGGPGKRITWDLAKDQAEIDDEILIEVLANTSPTEAAKKDPPVTSGKQTRKVSVGKAIVLSMLLPGAGNTYVTGGGTQWLWGVVGYGCIFGSISMNNRAARLLDDYRVSIDPGERDQLYNDAKTFNIVSKSLLGAAAAIWVVDVIWTAAQASKTNKYYRQSRVSLTWSYEQQHQIPQFGVRYKF